MTFNLDSVDGFNFILQYLFIDSSKVLKAVTVQIILSISSSYLLGSQSPIFVITVLSSILILSI